MWTNMAESEVECCGKFFLIPAFAFAYGIPKAEQQVIRFLKKEFIFQGFIYILFWKDNP